jgi:hypothetical protein
MGAEPITALHGITKLTYSHTPFRFPRQSGKTLVDEDGVAKLRGEE